MCLNSILLEGVVVSTAKTRRRMWLTIDSDGVYVKCFATGSMAERSEGRISEGMFLRMLGKITKGMKIELNHIENYIQHYVQYVIL